MKKVYLAGGITGIDIREAVDWRVKVQNLLKEEAEVFNPIFDSPVGSDQRPYQLYRLKHSDVVLVNFNTPSSIGTAQELAYADAYGIPVVGLNAEHCRLHPWLEQSCLIIFDDMNDVLEYLRDYFL